MIGKQQLLERIGGMVQYLLLKVEERDWHGVADAAMDLREMEAKLELLEELNIEE
jgi:hypothetical protein